MLFGWPQVRILIIVEEVNCSTGCDEQHDKKHQRVLVGKEVKYKTLLMDI